MSACGGPAVLALAQMCGRKPLLIAVEENETVLDQTPERLLLPALHVKNYWEALGVIAAHRAGVDPWALRKNGVAQIQRRGVRSSSEGFSRISKEYKEESVQTMVHV
eukprot:TRINITY_DN7091_c0_g1_i1.p1 TRINITY_DN7091_c0_g1~~TRINITY_DN7091_c0_g1_i1.p1  ORF type:complete len:107 (-),score=2.59 TRINITY_DN7091_c0_g1_i1:131-451(-)